MIIAGEKLEAIFLEKLNRFVARVECGGREILVHIPNSGRLTELLVTGARVILRDSDNPKRKYRYSLILVEKAGILVSVDSLLPNRIVIDALKRRSEILKRGPISKLLSYGGLRSEVRYNSSRFDVGLYNDSATDIEYYLEVKGVTLVEEKRALFPDAPTKRGARHLRELAELSERGLGAGVVFIIQREDAKVFAPNDKMDQDFGAALRLARAKGVDIFALACQVERDKLDLLGEIPVMLVEKKDFGI